MTRASLHPVTIGLLLLVGVAAPLLFPAYTNQIAVLWLMIVFAMTWDTLGGQMGYNSLGNIFFFGAGMYTCAVVQIGLYYDVGMYTSGARTTHIAFTTAQYFTGFAIGIVAAGIMAASSLSQRPGSCSDCAAPISRSGRSAWRSRAPSWWPPGNGSAPPRAYRCRYFRGLLRRKSCFSISCSLPSPSSCCFSAVALLDEFRHGHQCNPRRRRKGRSDGPLYAPLQADGVDDRCVLPRHRGRHFRQHDRLHRCARHRVSRPRPSIFS